MGSIVNSNRGSAYVGIGAQQPRDWHEAQRDPGQYDNGPQYNVGDEWQNTVTKTIWQLVSLAGTPTSAGALANWVQITASPSTIDTLTGDNAVVVNPIGNNINVIADTALLNCGSSVSILGNNSDATLSLNVTDSLDNTIIGQLAGKLGITGSENTACGGSSLSSLTTGSNNTVLGYAAGAGLSTGSNNIIIGNFLGSAALADTMVLGDSSITSAYMSGVAGVTVSNENLVTINTVTGQLGSISGSGSGTVTGLTTDDGHTVTPTAGVIIIHGTSGITTSGTIGPNTVTISGSGVVDTVPYTPVNNAASPYTVLGTDYYLGCDVTAGVISILLPNAPSTGRVFIVKDKVGSAATSNITVTTVGGTVTIDGATTFVMNTAYESCNVIFNGVSYEIW